MKRTNKKKGGLVCRPGFSTKNPFDLFMKMINNETASISSISYKSLYGFIFRLDIDPIANRDDPEEAGFYDPDKTYPFLQLNKELTAYDEPVYSLVIKMTLLSSDKEHSLSDYTRRFTKVSKFSQKDQDFIDEGEIQSAIYKSTVSKGDPISLPVAVNSILDTSVASRFISNILEYKKVDKLSRHMLQYISQTLTGDSPALKLGVLVMESATDLRPIYIPLYRQTPGMIRGFFDPKIKLSYDKMFSTIMYKLALLIIRLYIETGYIHKDLHLNNAMVNNDADNLILRIIDYGRVFKEEDSSSAMSFSIPIFTQASKRKIPQTSDELLDILEQIILKSSRLNDYLYYFISDEKTRMILLENIRHYYDKPDIIPDCYSKVTTSYPTLENVQYNSPKTGGRTKKTRSGVKKRTMKRRQITLGHPNRLKIETCFSYLLTLHPKAHELSNAASNSMPNVSM